MNQDDFTWRDGERTIKFGHGVLAGAADSLDWGGWGGYELLSTPRALESAPAALTANASRVHEVASGAVNELAAELIDDIGSGDLAALGGGRVIDTAKAIAAVRKGRVAAIPTTLSGAEMSQVHKLPDGHVTDRLVRPTLVFADPELMTAQPEEERRASAMNALAHGADSLYTSVAHPVSRLAALQGVRLVASGLDDERALDNLALGSLLCGYALDTALYSLHHVICQSLVRVMRIPHAETNAAILPRALEALSDRVPEQMHALGQALGTDSDGLPGRVEALAGGRRTLGSIGADGDLLDEALDTMLGRGELGMTPEPPGRDELRDIVQSAW